MEPLNRLNSCIDSGLLWVETRVQQLAAELGRPVDCLEWPRQRPAAEALTLKVWRGGEYRVLEFARQELLKAEGDTEVQGRLGERKWEA